MSTIKYVHVYQYIIPCYTLHHFFFILNAFNKYLL